MRHFIRATLLALAVILATPSPQFVGDIAQAEAALIDINSAPKAQLDALPGIGAARAEAIIKNRPYNGKDDLVQRKIIPENVYNGIKDKIIARQKKKS
jgi:DNA uptake protein ComE-like DNA-binding protein